MLILGDDPSALPLALLPRLSLWPVLLSQTSRSQAHIGSSSELASPLVEVKRLGGCPLLRGRARPLRYQSSVPRWPHSYRRQMAGSTLVARQAGSQQAAMQVSSKIIGAKASVAGSRGETPQSWLATMRDKPRLTGSPKMMPITTRRAPLRITRRRTSPALAPSAMRMPISCVRHFVLYVITL